LGLHCRQIGPNAQPRNRVGQVVAAMQHETYQQLIHNQVCECMNNLWAVCGSSVDTCGKSRMVNPDLFYMP
jgi:hypothetical protein